MAALPLRAGFLSALTIQVQVLERRLQPAAVIPNPVSRLTTSTRDPRGRFLRCACDRGRCCFLRAPGKSHHGHQRRGRVANMCCSRFSRVRRPSDCRTSVMPARNAKSRAKVGNQHARQQPMPATSSSANTAAGECSRPCCERRVCRVCARLVVMPWCSRPLPHA